MLTRIALVAVTVATAPLIAACPWCADGELRLLAGELPAAPGATLSFELRFDDYRVGGDHCGGSWYVDGILGGDLAVGTVDACGRYTAPSAPPPEGRVRLEASRYPVDGCADCCPWAARDIPLAQP